MGFHTDIAYSHAGVYVEKLNGQKENTPTVIVNIGDKRNLKWRRRILKYDINTGRNKWELDTSWKQIMHISSGSVVIVNPLDEIPSIDPSLGTLIQYQHGGVVVTGNKFSCAFAFRVVKEIRLYNKNNQMSVPSSMMSEESLRIMNEFDVDHFHENIKHLYRQRVADVHNEISSFKMNI